MSLKPRDIVNVKKPRVLIVDDEPQIVEMISDILSDQFETISSENGEEALNKIRLLSPDVILLDLIMPRMDGLNLCKAVRSDVNTRHIPILVITAANTPDHRLKSYNLGADDFLTKPFGIEELECRVLSKYRRSKEMAVIPTAILKLEDLSMNLNTFDASVGGEKIDLTACEFGLLKLFVQNHDRLVRRDEILTVVWGDNKGSDRIIDAHIVSIRKYLKASRLKLKTVYGAGYILLSSNSNEKVEE